MKAIFAGLLTSLYGFALAPYSAAAVVPAPLAGQSQLASAKMVERLLAVMHAQKLITDMQNQMVPWMKSVTTAVCQGAALNPEERSQVEAMTVKVRPSAPERGLDGDERYVVMVTIAM